MKKLLILLIPLLLCSCTQDMNRKEIDEIDLIRVMGIDYTDNHFILTALYNSSQGADSEAGSGGEPTVMKGTGDSVYEAFEDLRLKNKKAISLAHTGFYLLGSGAGQQGIDLCLDFLSRDETIKMESLIFIVKDTDASSFMEKGIEDKQLLHEDLEAISQKQQEVIKRNDNKLVNLINDMDQANSCVLIPYILPGEEGFTIEGYAVFDQFILQDYLDKDTSDGIRFLRNMIRRYPIYLVSQVGLQITNSKTDMETDIVEGDIQVTVEIEFETMIKEVYAKEDIFNLDRMDKLTQEQNEYIKKILSRPIDYTIATGMDILGLAGMLKMKHASEWETMESEWQDKLADIKYDYILQSKIAKSFIMGNER